MLKERLTFSLVLPAGRYYGFDSRRTIESDAAESLPKETYGETSSGVRRRAQIYSDIIPIVRSHVSASRGHRVIGDSPAVF